MTIAVDTRVIGAEAVAREMAAAATSTERFGESAERAGRDVDRLERALAEQTREQRRAATQMRATERAASSMGRGMRGTSIQARQASRSMAEVINVTTETALGFGALNPVMREFTTVAATAGNNAFLFANTLGPVGVLLGVVATALPGVIGMLGRMAGEMDEAAASASNAADQVDGFAAALTRLQERRRGVNLARALRTGTGTVDEQQALVSNLEGALAELQERQGAAAQDVARLRGGLEDLSTGGFRQYNEDVAEATRRSDALALSVQTVTQRLVDARANRDAALAGQVGEVTGETVDDTLTTNRFGDVVVDGEVAAPGRESPNRRGDRPGSRGRQGRGQDPDDILFQNLSGYEERLRAAERQNQEFLDALGDAEAAAAQARDDIDAVFADRKAEREAERIAQIEANAEKELELIIAIEQERQRMAEQRSEMLQELEGEVADTVVGFAQDIGRELTGAFQMAIEGEKSFEDAFESGSKVVLKSIGDQLVNRGIFHILDGTAMLFTNPPAAGVKLASGGAMIAIGAGLGAAGAAINEPGARAGAASEAGRPDRADDADAGSDGPGDLTLVLGQPILTAGTVTQLGQQIGDAFDQGRNRRRRIQRGGRA